MSDGSNTSIESSELLNSLRSEGDANVPEFVYIDLEPRFASIVFTLPNLQVQIPENPKPISEGGELSIKLRNNGRLRLDPNGFNQLNGRDWSKKQSIESVNWKGEEISGEELLERRKELLERFFEERLEGKENVEQAREMIRAAGLTEGSYLYRAISDQEYRELKATENKLVNHLDPSANFESEKMFNRESSQAKLFAGQQNDGGFENYSGHIIRWKIEDPLLYRPSGRPDVPRVVPMFAHFLPKEIEISDDQGESFKPLEANKSK